MSEERQWHPQEPAEGAEENVEARGADRAGGVEGAEGLGDEARSAEHPQEPAEGAEENVQAPGAERAGNEG